MKRIIVALIMCSLVGITAYGQQKDRGQKPNPDEQFKKMDSDSDGKISRDEANNSGGKLKEKFDNIDANKDGFLDKAEMEAFRKNNRPQRKG